MQKNHHHLAQIRHIYLGCAFIFCLVFFGATVLAAQTPVKYDIFYKPSLGGLAPKTPAPTMFEDVSTKFSQDVTGNSQSMRVALPTASIGNMNSNIAEMNQQLMSSDLNRMAGLPPDVVDDIQQQRTGMAELEWIKRTTPYRIAFDKLMRMNPDSFSLTEAVFTVENAYFDNKMAVSNHKAALQRRTDAIRQMLKREGLNPKDNVALNYGIQKLFQSPVAYYDKKLKRTVTIKPFTYDFKDYRGEEHYYNMFVSKMMVMNSGQCHSMPLMYLMLAEQLDAKAWLSLAPQHSFVQFQDKNGNLLNFETTNGNLVSSNWLLQSGFINANALKEKTYMDTLSRRQLFTQCLADLLLGYMNKFGYDPYAEKIQAAITAIYPRNLTAALIDANLKTRMALDAIRQVGMPKEDDLPNYPSAYHAYITMHQSYERVDGMGYQDMPEEAYRAWLKTIESEKKKQETRELRERMQQEIRILKRPISTVRDRTKD